MHYNQPHNKKPAHNKKKPAENFSSWNWGLIRSHLKDKFGPNQVCYLSQVLELSPNLNVSF